MKNLLLKAVMISSLAAVGALAEGGFIGVQGGYDFGNFKAYGGYFYGLKADYSRSDAAKSEEVEQKTHDFVVGGDFTPTISSGLKFVLGAYTGVSVLDIDAKEQTPAYKASVSDSVAGWLLGAKLGLAYEFDANNEVEVGFKASKAWYDGDTSDYLNDIDGTRYGAYAGYSYKF